MNIWSEWYMVASSGTTGIGWSIYLGCMNDLAKQETLANLYLQVRALGKYVLLCQT